MTLDARSHVGRDILLVTLDTLRFDVAQRAWREGMTPALAALLPSTGWERRHTPGSFTFAAHCAFFAGFLPTPVDDPRRPRLFAASFEGSETTGDRTLVVDAADLPTGLAALGYHTACIGGVGFFNPSTPLGRVLPAPFAERHWSPALGVTSPHSTRAQVDLALEVIGRCAGPLFLFVNVSALHQPNCIFVDGAEEDSPATMAAALAYTDAHLGRLVEALRRRGPLLAVLTSDHGTSYGEDDRWGHRHAHPTVWEVPYAELLLEAR